MKCISPMQVKIKKGIQKGQRTSVPCGVCTPCLQNKRRDWSFRLSQELRTAVNACFVTLTYDPKHVPLEIETMEPTLQKYEVQDFIKKLRTYQDRYWKKLFDRTKPPLETQKHLTEKYLIRFYAVGEYGEGTGRPHYHIILFNLTKEIKNNLQKIWKKGHIDVGDVNPKSINYITKYVIGRSLHTLEQKIEAPFALMSRNPGIGHSYLRDDIAKQIKAYHNGQKKALVLGTHGKLQSMPQYYKNKIFDEGLLKYMAKKNLELGDELYQEQYEKIFLQGVKNIEIRRMEQFDNMEERLNSRIKKQSKL